MDDELEPKKLPIDLESEVGMTRRDLIRRSAIVGGALLWAAPTIQSIGMKAAGAQPAPAYGPSPGSCAACYCYTLRPGSPYLAKDAGTEDGHPIGKGLFTADDCENWCKWQAGYTAVNGAPNGPFAQYKYCSGTATATESCDAPPSRGVVDPSLNVLPGNVTCP